MPSISGNLGPIHLPQSDPDHLTMEHICSAQDNFFAGVKALKKSPHDAPHFFLLAEEKFCLLKSSMSHAQLNKFITPPGATVAQVILDTCNHLQNLSQATTYDPNNSDLINAQNWIHNFISPPHCWK